jgi:hypothetical protein
LKLIEKAQRSAKKIHDQDPDLSKPEHAQIAMSLAYFWGENQFEPQSDVS